ncbi:MAG: hypothetical protein VW665_03860, partial [Candidatus Puniceispirillum sp.]
MASSKLATKKRWHPAAANAIPIFGNCTQIDDQTTIGGSMSGGIHGTSKAVRQVCAFGKVRKVSKPLFEMGIHRAGRSMTLFCNDNLGFVFRVLHPLQPVIM